MDSAPREKPASASKTMVISETPCHSPPLIMPSNSMNNMLKPNTANPATPNPMTVPPLKDTFNACAMPVRAAWVVRTFACVAIRMPMFPAIAEKMAPITNATTIQ